MSREAIGYLLIALLVLALAAMLAWKAYYSRDRVLRRRRIREKVLWRSRGDRMAD